MTTTKDRRLLGLAALLAMGLALAGCMGDDDEATEDGVGDGLGDTGATNDTGDTGATNDTGDANDTATGNDTGNESVIGEGEAPQAPPTFPPEGAAEPGLS